MALQTLAGKLYDLNIIKRNSILFEEGNLHEDTMFLFSYLKHITRVTFIPIIGYEYYIEENHNGLSSQVTSAKNLLVSQEHIKTALDEICTTFNFSQEQMASHYEWIAWNMIRAAKICYRNNYDYGYRKHVLENIDRNFIEKFYKADSLIEKVIKFFICKTYRFIAVLAIDILYKVKYRI